MLAKIRPSANLTSFNQIISSVGAHFPWSHGLDLRPTMEPHLLKCYLKKIWWDDASYEKYQRIVWAEAFFDVLNGQVFLKPENADEQRLREITPFESVGPPLSLPASPQ